MDINLVHHLGASGRTLSMEEKATLQVTLLQRSREVRRPSEAHNNTPRNAHTALELLFFFLAGEPREDDVLG